MIEKIIRAGVSKLYDEMKVVYGYKSPKSRTAKGMKLRPTRTSHRLAKTHQI
jgi:hypothetical protein